MNDPASGWPEDGINVALLPQRLSHALRDAAMRLAVDDQRIDAAADVVDRGVARELESPVSGSISISQIAQPFGNTGS